MKKILPLFVSLFLFWPIQVVEWVLTYKAPAAESQVMEAAPMFATCGTCPELVGLMIDPCAGTGAETDNEYAIFVSGNGFAVDDLLLDLDPNNNILGAQNNDPGSAFCPLMDPVPSLISAVQGTAPCAIAAGPGDVIPCCAIVILFTSGATPSVVNNFSYICGLGFDIYVVQNSCVRNAGAFTNGGAASPNFRTYELEVSGCPLDAITYDRSTFPTVNPLTDHVIVDEFGTAYVTMGSCQPDLSDLTFPAMPSLPTISAMITDETCPGQANGAINLTITGGLSPYCVDWSHIGGICPAGNPEDISGLAAGDYNVTVSDASGCIDVATFTVLLQASPVDVEFFPSGTTCAGEPTGNVFINVTGGSTPYEFDWDWTGSIPNDVYDFLPADGFEDQDLANLYSGTYNLTVTDANGCSTVESVVIDEDATEIITSAADVALNCYGESANINLSVSGGIVMTYTFDWDNDGLGDNNDMEDLFGVEAGTYIVIVTENITGCEVRDTVLVTQSDSLIASTVGTDSNCDNTNGSYVITVTGGTPPFDYNDGPHSGMNVTSPITVSNVAPGSYTVTVTDDNGCTATSSVTINAPDPIVIDFFPSGTTCAGQPTGSVFISVTGGVPGYSFNWDWLDGMGDEVFDVNPVDGMDDQDLNNLFPGMYSLTVTDANGCTEVATVQIDEDATDIITSAADIVLDCYDDVADINLSVSGGIVMTYTYDWNNDGTGDFNDPQDLTGVGAGTYIVVVMENVTGCLVSDTVTVTEPPELVATATPSIAICGGTPSGSISVAVVGGVGPYDFVVNSVPFNPLNTQTGNNLTSPIVISNVGSGMWAIIITDANGCTDFEVTVVNEAPPLSAMAESGTIQCFGGTTDVWVEPIGGTPPFCYDWDAASGATCMSMTPISEPDTLYNVPAGSYSVTVLDANDCMTVAVVTVTEPAEITTAINASICANESYTMPGGAIVNSPGIYVTTLVAANGCDSIVTVTLTVNPLFTNTVNTSHCAGDSVQVYGVWYTGPVMTSDTVASATGCDTVVTINVSVTPLLTKTVNANHCNGDSVQVYGIWYTGPVAGALDTAMSTTGGCDTVVTINVSVTPLLTKTVNANHCNGDSVQVYGIWYTGPVTGALDTALSTTGGCDTVVTINVSVTPLLTKTVNANHCNGDSVQVYGIWYTGPVTGALDTAMSTTGGCDTVVTINVSVTPLLTKTVNANHCNGDSVQVYGIWYTGPVAGALDTAMSTTGGCDTVLTINVSVTPLLTKTVNANHCNGDSVQVYGIWYTGPVAGALDTAMSTTGGCDTVLTINVSVTPLLTKTVNANHCNGDSVQVYGIWYTGPVTGALDTALSTTGGCDTVVTINVSVTPLLTKTVNANHCNGDSVQVYGIWYTSPVAGALDTALSTTGGCDTVVTINVSVTPLLTKTVSAVFCAGDSVQVYGVWYDMVGSFTDTVNSITAACDTIVTIIVTQENLIPKTFNLSHCPGDSVQVNGVWYFGPANATDTITSITGGCDTLATINVSLLSPSMSDLTNDGCTGDGFSVTVNGTLYNEANPTGVETLTGANGCDSVVTINLVFNNTSTGNETYTGCAGDGYSVVVGGMTYDEANPSGTETLTNADGCDSVVTIALTFNSTSMSDETYTGCEGDGYSVVVNGTMYDEGNPTGMETMTNADGCDSVVTINLTFNAESTGSETYDGCFGDGYSVVVNGTTYNESNPTGMETLPNAAGCDSVVTISLTFGSSVTGDETYTGCEGDGYSVVVGGTTYNEGNPNGMETLISGSGCDSIVTIDLTFNAESTGDETYTGCVGDGYSVVVGGTTYDEGNPSGTETLTNAGGCDSVVTIALTFNNTSTGDETYTGCEGDGYSVVVGGTTYDETNPTGSETLTNAEGCDSLVTINLTFNAESTGNETYTGCVGDGYAVIVNGTTYDESNPSGMETLSNAAGCDSVVTISLTFNSAVTGDETYTGCEGDGYSVVVGGTTYNEGNPSGMETLVSGSGCDSIVTIDLTFNAESTGDETYTGCAGDGYSVVVGGTTYNEGNPSGMETLVNADGCDSVVTIALTFNNTSTGDETYTGCEGDGYFVVVGGTTYDETNPTGTETLTNSDGCDSVVTINLTFNAESTGNETYAGCFGDGYFVVVNGTTYDESNPIGTEDLTNANGCDSLVIINLTFSSTVTGDETYLGCQGDGYSVVVDGTIYNESNPSGTENLISSTGCDSIIFIDLIFNPPTTGDETYTGCVGDGYSVVIGGTTYDEGNPAGMETLVNADGCDSIVTIALTFNNTSTGDETYTGCTGDGYSVVVGGTTYDEGNPSGMETLTNAAGCDSVVTVSLTFNNTSTGDETYTGCAGDGYSVVVGGTTYNEGNPTGMETLTNADGCDSVVTVNLIFNSNSTGDETYSGCQGDGYSVVVGGTTYDESNPSGTETLTSGAGCDSVVTIDLTFNAPSTGDETYTGCQGDGYSVVVGGTTYDESNPTGSETLTNGAGCDSVVTITLTFNSTSTGNETYTGCEGDGYTVVVGGTTYDESNPTGSESLTNAEGCDSVVTINLTFNAESTGDETYTGCAGDGYTVVVGGTTYNESNPTGTETLTNSDGCDSVVTINLTFNNNVTGDETYTGCQGDGYSVVVGGTTYNESNPSGTETLISGAGCDSIVTIDLTFNAPSTGDETYTGCQGDGYSVIVGGTTYDESNPTGSETLTNGVGCDSIVTVALTFNASSTGDETYTGCEGDGYSVVVGGTTYDESNPTGSETLTNGAGCDSIVTINLTFNAESTGDESYTGCEGDGYSVVVGGTTYDESNPTGSETLSNANGCDSVVTINLTFNSNETGDETYTGCQGDGYSVVVGGTTYGEGNPSGTETLTSGAGCDSIVTIDLTFNAPSTGDETYTGCEGDGYSVVVGGTTYDESNPAGSETLTNGAGCDSIVTIALTFNSTSTGDETYTGCEGDGYSVVVGGTTYDESNPTGSETLTNADGCDSIVTIVLTFNSTSTGDETYTGCEGDGYSVVVGGTTYDEGNPTGSETLTNAQGCDSIVTINLIFNSTSSGNETYSGCIGDGYSVVVGGTTYDEGNPAGMETIPGANGCDSVVTILLTFNSNSTGSETYTGCSGDGYSVVVGGTTYDESNPSGMETLTSGSGCDSIVTISLTFNATSTGDETYTGCQGDGYSVVVGSTTYDESNPTGSETLTNGNGCDSIVTINLTFNATSTGDETYTGCTGDGYEVIVNGTPYNEGNPAGTETLQNADGCDSAVTIFLIFNNTTSGDELYNGCIGDGYSVVVGGTTYDETNPTGTETLTGVNGCDSLVTINLVFSNAVTGDELYTGCSGDGYSVVVNGNTYDESNPTGSETLTTSGGCDSIVTINLVFNSTSIGDELYNGCTSDGYEVIVNGIPYNEANPTGTEILTNINGCDSTVTIDLTFNPSSTGEELYSGCIGDNYSVVVNGTIYNEANPTGSETLSNSIGCDSVVTINLSFNNTSTGTETYNGCIGDGYSVVVNGTTYDESNPTGTEVLPNSNGCDSTVTINLMFSNSVTGDELYSGCIGDGYSVIVGGTTYDESNPTGMETLTSSGGCDSIVTIDLMFASSVTGDELYSGCEGDGYSVVVNGTTYNESNPSGTETLPSSGGCDSIVTIDLDFATAPIASITPAGPFCADQGPQVLVASPAGGTWSGDISTNQFNPSVLGPGQYEVIYTVSDGTCDDADTILISVNPEVNITCVAVLGESAPNAMDGTGNVTVSTGTAPYDIDWSGPTMGSDVLAANGTYTMTGLSVGTYSITVTDANGCSAVCGFDIISSNCTLVIDDVDIIDAGCVGVDNGAVQINASGGTPPYMYSDDGINYQSSNTFSGLAAGAYTFFVQDDAGCIASIPVNILAGAGPTIEFVSGDPSSCGQANGSITVTATGGTPPYNFSNGGGFQPIGTFNGLAANSYIMVVRDDNGCTDTIVVDVIDDGAPIIEDIIIVDANCGLSDGSITVIASGGAGTLMYSLNNGPLQTSNVFLNRPSGNYLVEVIDENGCEIPAQVQIMDISTLMIDNTIITETECGVNTGSVQVIASGGTGALSYQIDNGTYGPNSTFINLSGGPHTINVRDASGCIETITINVPSANGPQITSTPVVHTTCGQDNGQITINATGGTGDLTYCIDPGNCDDVNEFEDLEAGSYEITVEDENGCSAQTTVTINDSEGPTVDQIQEDENCDNGNGLVIIFGIGGVEPYMYSFDGRPYSNNDTYTGLSSDFYDICVRDAQGCIDCKEIFIDNDPPPVITNVSSTQSSCDQCDGTITILATSFLDLEYSINCVFYQTSNVFTDICPGTYTICVRDEEGCVTQQTHIIAPLPEPTIEDVIVLDAACTAPGSLTVIVSGGNGNYQYSLNNVDFQSSNVFLGLGANTYTVYVVDDRGCTDQTTATIDGPMLDNTSLVETICEGETFTVGTQDFVATGLYTIPLVGSDGCDSTVILNLTVEFCCTISEVTLDTVICEGQVVVVNGTAYGADGSYIETVVGGAANGCDSIITLNLGVIPAIVINDLQEICDGESFDWNGQMLTQTGFYTDTLISAVTGCDSIMTLDLTVNPLPDVDAGADQILSCSVMTVTLDGSGTGSPQWSGPVSDPNTWQTQTSTPGTFYLTATSAEGCIAIDSVVVNVDPNFPVANAGPDQFITCEDTTVTLQGSANGPGLLFTWTGPGIEPGQENFQMPVVDTPGTYILTVENDDCTSSPDTVIVTDIRVDLLANINADGNLDCVNNDVLLTATGSSSGPGIVYIWLNPIDQISLDVPSITATIPGTYFLFAIDTLSMCQAVDSHDVLDLTAIPPADAGVDTILDCNIGMLDLEANANVQQDGLLFSWSGPVGGISSDPNQKVITIVLAGTYTVTVLDTTNGCTNTDQVIVVDGRNAPNADAGPSQLINCNDDTAILDGSNSSTGIEYDHIWNGPGVQNVHAISIEVQEAGWYQLRVMNLSNGCEAVDSAEVQMADFLSGADLTLLDPICLGDMSGEIIVDQPIGGVSPYTYSLDGIIFQSSPIFENLAAGTYSLIIRDNVNCEWDTTVVINEGIELTLNIGPDLELDFGDMHNLLATVVPPGIIDSIVWIPADVLSCTDCLDPILTVLHQNNFTITATVYANTCEATDHLLVIVDNDFNIFVPNIFSPNHDNINDFVTAFAGDQVEMILEFEIYDRWGELIFRNSNFPPNVPELGWNGDFKGKPMNPGVFVYVLKVELIDGTTKVLSGDVMLLR